MSIAIMIVKLRLAIERLPALVTSVISEGIDIKSVISGIEGLRIQHEFLNYGNKDNNQSRITHE